MPPVTDALLNWCIDCTRGYKNIQITNWTTCWKDGLAYSALVHFHNPTAFDFESLKATNALHNLELAFSVAKSDGVPQLLDAEDLQLPIPDARSNITYISL